MCVFFKAGAGWSGEAQLLGGGGDRLLQPGTQDLAPAGLARLGGGLHLHHSADRRKRHVGPWGRLRVVVVMGGEGGDGISSVSVGARQNFCSEAVCYSEMMTRKLERSQLGRDYKSFATQVKPRARHQRGWGGGGGGKQ